MRNKLLAVAAIAGALGVPLAAQAQTVGIVRGESVIVDDDAGIAVDQRPAFREYIVRERVPNYTVQERVIVGGVLPEAGVTYYNVPQTFGATPYRYTVVNGQTVLVEPRTRRIVQVVDINQDLNDQSGRRASGCARAATGQKGPARRSPAGSGLFLCSRVPDAAQRAALLRRAGLARTTGWTRISSASP